MDPKTYVSIRDGLVVEVIPPSYWEDGLYIPIEARYNADFISTLVDVTGMSPVPDQWWTYDGTTFTPPVPPSAQTPAEILATNTATRNRLLAAANLVIPALQDAVDLDDPSANPALLLSWKQFRVAVNKVILTVSNPVWPTAPQSGYGADVATRTVTS